MGSRLLLLTDLNGRLQQVNALEITPDRSMIAAAGEPARPPADPGTGTGQGDGGHPLPGRCCRLPAHPHV